MSATAIILARAGSRGLPGKNIRPIAGRPCIAWTIAHAQASRRVNLVVVSTDDERAAGVAHEMGAHVVHRPADLAHDSARVDDAARHALREVEARALVRGDTGSHVVLLYANVPVRPPDLTDRAVDLLERTGCDSVQSYSPVGRHHPWWTARLDPEGRVAPWEGHELNHGVFRRQDLPPAFIPDGGVIALTRRALMLEVPGVPPGPHAFFGLDRRGVTNPEGSVVDIDCEIDALVGEAILARRSAQG
jgi:CMP-N,N'-diacetyllegionaminic acid synthase